MKKSTGIELVHVVLVGSAMVAFAMANLGCSNAKFEAVGGPVPVGGPVGVPAVVNPNSGLSCDVYQINTPSNETLNFSWPQLLSNSTLLFSTTLSKLNATSNSCSDNEVPNLFSSNEQSMLPNSNYAIDCYGYITVPETGLYNLQLGADDGATMILDDQLFINEPNAQCFTNSVHQGAYLGAGKHAITVMYFQATGGSGLALSWQGPKNQGLGNMSTIGAQYLSH